MAKSLTEVLRVVAQELIEKGYDSDEVVRKINQFDLDFSIVREGLAALELQGFTDEAELDTIRALLAFILIKDTDLDIEDIYAFIFSKGRHITWS